MKSGNNGNSFWLLCDNQMCYDNTDSRIEVGESKRYIYTGTKMLIVVELYKN
jgi:hypothetical protein